MLPGFAGHLIAEAFLEELLVTADHDSRRAHERFRADLMKWRAGSVDFGPASTPRALLHASATPLLLALGYDPPTQIEAVDSIVAATVTHGRHRTALLVSTWAEPLERLWRLAVTQAIRRTAEWCLIFNGVRLRLVDASRLYARRFAEFDLSVAVDDERSCAALFRVAAAPALTNRDQSTSLHATVDASNRHAAAVCRSLKDGVLSASADVLGALIGRAHTPADGLDDSFEQALTIVYRILFLLFAEARSLVPLWHPVYRQSYSVETLVTSAQLPVPAPGLWDALRAIARLAHGGCRAGDLRVTPFNGRLFSPARTPLAERRGLDDEAARRAILSLSTRPSPDRAGRGRIAYRDLGVEQLGAVYETLLDYEPHVRPAARPGIPDCTTEDPAERSPNPVRALKPPCHQRPLRSPARGRHRLQMVVTLEPGSGTRKATGTFYTPQPIADYLVRRTLGPLVADLTAESVLRLRVVDPAMGSGAFLVAANRYLAAAYEAALIREGRCHASDLGETERASIRRSIAERCLYGVDVNPMAVQLARLSLWLATLSADRPLTFLDHRLQAGDSLLGAWVASLRHPPRPQRQPAGLPPLLPLFDDGSVREALSAAVPVRFSIEATPTDSIEQVRAKERAFAAMTGRGGLMSRWKRVADVWCASWFARSDLPPSAFGVLSDAMLAGHSALPARTVERCLATVESVSSARRFFHWELEYPEVFFDAEGKRLPNGGFDAVIGNPPWDMIRADTGSREERSRARFDTAAVLRFTRDAGIYQAQSAGHANRYQLFVERAIDLTRAGGRIGLVLPSGLATDHGSSGLRRRLLNRCAVDAIVGIDNHRGVFPIHRSVRFLLVTASAGTPTREIGCRFGIGDPSELEAMGEPPAHASASFPVRLTPALLERLSGPGLTIPSFRGPADLAVAERAASLFPPLGSDAGWAATFGRELNATDDREALHSTSGRFRLPGSAPLRRGRTDRDVRRRRPDRRRSSSEGRLQPDSHVLPVVEGKHLEPFRIDFESVGFTIRAADAQRLLPSDRHRHPRLAYRDVASATNRMTLIAAVLPPGCVSTHTVFCLRTPLASATQHYLCGLFNTLVVNYLVRQRVSTHVTTAIVESLPLPTREHAPAAFREIAALARQLARRADPAALARLNALVARLYQLSHAEFEYVVETFPLVPREEREAALRLFLSS
jgi:hypothetical protein